VYAGLFIAVSVVLTRFISGNVMFGGISILRLSFGQVPLFLSGILLGPVYGALSGALADIIGYPLNPLGPYFPGFTLSSALSGLIPGLFARYARKDMNWLYLLGVIAFSEFVTAIFLNSIWIHMLTGKAVFAIVPAALISRIILVPIHVTLVKFVLKFKRQLALQG
jgi:ECF transporter S component (folate family)